MKILKNHPLNSLFYIATVLKIEYNIIGISWVYT